MKTANRIFPAICLLAVFLLCLSPIRLDDIFLYLAFGRKLIQDGSFGPVDTLIFTIRDYQWQLWHEWLAFVIYYATQSLAGYEGLIVLRAALVTATAFVVWKACDRARLNSSSTLALIAVAVYVASPRIFRDRSSVFTDLFLLTLLYALTDARIRSGKWKWLLPGIFLAWVQIHSGYLIGWFFIGLYYLANFWTWSNRERRDWFLLGVACVLITLVNPIFIEGVLWPFRAIFGSDWGVLGQITEFAPTMITDTLDLPYKIFFGIFLAAGVVVSALAVRRDGPFLLLVALTLTGLGLKYSRMVALAGFGMSLIVAASLARAEFVATRRPSTTGSILACALALAACVYLFANQERGARFLFAGAPLHNSVPEKAAQFIMTLPPGNIFNEWVLGGFLAWELDGRQKIAAHGFVSDPALVQRYIYNFSVSREGWENIVLGNNVQYFFLRRQTYEESRGAAWIEELNGPAWQPIYADGAAIIFSRKP